MLGLIVSEITNPFFPELVQEFENLAVAQGYEVLIGSTNYEPERTESLIRRMLQRNIDGVAVMTFGIEEDLVQKLVEREFPLVFVDAGPNLPNIRILKVNYGEEFARRCSIWLRWSSQHCLHYRAVALAVRGGTARRISQGHGRTGAHRAAGACGSGQSHDGGGIAAMESLIALEVCPRLLCARMT